MEKKIEIKKKIINHLIVNGKKSTSEKIFIKTAKELQKQSDKQFKKLIQLSLIHSSPIFKLHTILNKKRKKKNPREIPAFVSNKYRRVSLAIKFILKTTKNRSSNFFNVLKQEILSNSKFESGAIDRKNDLQIQALLNKRYFSYYRWN